MNREKFGKLLQKYLRNDCTPEEKRLVEHWYSLLENQPEQAQDEENWDQLESSLWTKIHAEITPPEPVIQQRDTPVFSLWKVASWAAVLAVVLGIGFWFSGRIAPDSFTENPTQTADVSVGWITKTNMGTQPMVVQLEDGSTVRLQAKSSLRYPKQFDSKTRTVHLTGDAFFAIQKMPSKPFFVHTNDVVTKVLGTSFFIRSQGTSRQIKVEVVTGRVVVYQNGSSEHAPSKGVVLKPNQMTTFFEEQEQFVTGLVENPKLIQLPETETKPLSFQFNDTPLSEVIDQLERAYGIQIELENENQNHCPLTADLSNQSLYAKLDIICAALKSKYEVRGTTILLSGKSCMN